MSKVRCTLSYKGNEIEFEAELVNGVVEVPQEKFTEVGFKQGFDENGIDNRYSLEIGYESDTRRRW